MSLQREREALIAAPRRPGRPFRLVAALALAVAIAFLWWTFPSVAYYASPTVPIDLGGPGDFHFERALSNRYARVQGETSSQGWYVREAAGEFTITGLDGTPLVIRRPSTIEERLPGKGGKPPPPSILRGELKGRLLKRSDARQYEEVFAKHAAASRSASEWILFVGANPRTEIRSLLGFIVIAVFAALNALLLVASFLWKRDDKELG